MKKLDQRCVFSNVPIFEGDKVLLVVVQITVWTENTLLEDVRRYQASTPQERHEHQETELLPINPIFFCRIGTYDGDGGINEPLWGGYTYSIHGNRHCGDEEFWVHTDIAEALLGRPLNPNDLANDVAQLIELASQLRILLWSRDEAEDILVEEKDLRLQLKLSEATSVLLEKQICKFH